MRKKDCLIRGSQHPDMPNSMYIDICGNIMCVKCQHPECFDKTYPCEHTISLTKNEMIVENWFNEIKPVFMYFLY